MELAWERTLIGGQTKPFDFMARNGETSVGSIYRHDTSQYQRGQWFWSITRSALASIRTGKNCAGTVETKAEAVRLVEDTYQPCRT